MGGVSSKAVRKFPKRSEPPSWAGARAPAPGEHSPSRPALPGNQGGVESEGPNPQFLSNLNRLGPVKVDHHMQSILTSDRVKRAHETLLQSEREAITTHGTHNRLLAGSLSDLLEERKRLTSRDGLEALAKRYDMDVAKLERLARIVNVPSVHDGEKMVTVDKDGVEHINVKAIWVQPPFATHTRQAA